MSRIKAKKAVRGTTLRAELEARDILIRCDSDAGLAEEAPVAYKDVHLIIDICTQAHLAEPVVELKPLAVIKGG